MVQCAGCERPILDRFLLNVLDRPWHAKCVQCTDCKCNLSEKCFSRDGKLYCRGDFFRRYGTKCAGCTQGISPSDLVRRARNKVFHLKCFTCMVCRKQLSTGEELYVLDENKFICKEDYLNSKLHGSDVEDELDLESACALDNQGNLSDREFSLDGDNSPDSKENINTNICNNNNTNMMNNNTSGSLPGTAVNSPVSVKEEPLSDSATPNEGSQNGIGNANSSEGGDGGSGTKRRGPRTTIKAKQLETLKAAFNATPKPTRHIREQLAQETGLNMRVIQVWFQNRRSKERRMKQLSALGARRHFFRNPRRMRALRAGMSPHELDDSPEMIGAPAFGYFSGEHLQDSGGDFYPGYQGYNEFFPGQGPDGPGNMNFLPPSSQGTPPLSMDQQMHPAGMAPDAQFLPGDIIPPSSTPEPIMMAGQDGPFGPGGPPRSLVGSHFTQSMNNHPAHMEMAAEAW